MKLISDPWFDYVLSMYPDKVADACVKWSLAHDIAERFYSGKQWVLDDKTWDIIKVNDNIIKFHTLFVKSIIWLETRYVRDNISGTIDFTALIDYRWETSIMNCDYKSSNNKNEKYKLQLGGYMFLNGNTWILVYFWKNLELDAIWEEYMDIFIELKDYFFKLLLWH